MSEHAPPHFVSDYGVMSYGTLRGDTEVDFYFSDAKKGSVNLIYFGGPGFCLPHRICTDKPKTLPRLRRYYEVCDSRDENGTGREVVVLPGQFNGREVQSTFYSAGKRFLDFDIAFTEASTAAPCTA